MDIGTTLRVAHMPTPATTATGFVGISLFWLIRGLDNGAKYIDQALFRMFDLSERLSNEDELREYFTYVSKGDKDLEREKGKIATKQRVVQLIQDARKK